MGNIKQIFSEGDLNVDPGNIHNIYSKAKGSIDITTKHQLDPTVILTPYSAFIQNPGEEKTYNSNSVTEIPMNTYQSGGSAQDQQIQQLIMAYAQLSGQSPDQIMKQLQSLPKEQQQAALQNIAQTVQKAMEQQESQPDAESPQEDEQEMMARFGGTSEAYPQANVYPHIYQNGAEVYTPRDRASDSTFYSDYFIPSNIHKILEKRTFGSHEEIGSAEDFGGNLSLKAIQEFYNNPQKVGFAGARSAAVDAFRKKGKAGKLYLTNNEIRDAAIRFKDIDANGTMKTDSPIYGQRVYDIKNSLSEPDYWRLMEEIKRNASKKAMGGEAFPQANVHPHMYQKGSQVAERDATFNRLPDVMKQSKEWLAPQLGGSDYNSTLQNLLVSGLVDQAWGLGHSDINNAKELYNKVYNKELDNSTINAIIKRKEKEIGVGLNWATGIPIKGDYNKYLEYLFHPPKPTLTGKRDGGEAFPQAQTYLPDSRPHETRPNFMFQEGGSTDIDSIYNMMKSKGLNYNPKKKNGGKIDQLDKYKQYLQDGTQVDMFTNPDFHQEMYNNPNRAFRHYNRGYGKGWFKTNSDQPYRTDGAQMLMGTNNGQSGPAPYFPVNTYQYGKAGFDLLGNSPLSALTAGVFSGVAGWADQAHFRRQEKAMNNFGNSMSTVNTMPITAATSTVSGMLTGATNSMGSVFGANPTAQNTPSSTAPASSGSMLNPYTYHQTGGSIWDKYEDGSELNLEDLTEEEIQQIYRDGGSIEYI